MLPYTKLNLKNGTVLDEQDLAHIEEGIYENSIHTHTEYVEKSYVDAELENKVDKTYVDNQLITKVDQTFVNNAIATKTDKTYVDEKIISKADTTYVDTELAKKTPLTHSHSDYVLAVQGKGLSTNDYTLAEKSKLSTLSNYNDAAIRDLISQKASGTHDHNYVDLIGKPTLPDVEDILLKGDAATLYQGKLTANELTYIGKVPLLEGKVTTLEEKKTSWAELTGKPSIPEAPDLTPYVTHQFIETNYTNKTSIDSKFNEYTTTVELPVLYAQKTELNNYATKTELGNYLTTQTADTKFNLYTKTEDLPKTYATKSDLTSYVTTSDVEGKFLTTEQVTSIAKISTLESDVSNKLQFKEMTQATYNGLSTKDPNTLYVIVSS